MGRLGLRIEHLNVENLGEDVARQIALAAAAEAPTIHLPWLARDREALAKFADPSGRLSPADLPYKALGPRALTRYGIADLSPRT